MGISLDLQRVEREDISANVAKALAEDFCHLSEAVSRAHWLLRLTRSLWDSMWTRGIQKDLESGKFYFTAVAWTKPFDAK